MQAIDNTYQYETPFGFIWDIRVNPFIRKEYIEMYKSLTPTDHIEIAKKHTAITQDIFKTNGSRVLLNLHTKMSQYHMNASNVFKN